MEIRHHFNADIIQRITAKQVDLLYSHQPVAMFSTMLVVTILFSFLYTPEIAGHLTAIYLLFWTITILRSLVNWRYFNNRRNNTININRANKLYLAGIISNGLGWSIIILSLFPVVDLSGQILLLIVVMGFSAAAHTTMGFKKTPIIYSQNQSTSNPLNLIKRSLKFLMICLREVYRFIKRVKI